MLRALIISAILLLFVPLVCAANRDPAAPAVTPMMRTVDPSTAQTGQEATANGSNLDKAQVASVYLSQGDLMIKLTVISQTETEIRFKVPDTAKPGRYGITVLTTGKEPRYIDEPLFISVE